MKFYASLMVVDTAMPNVASEWVEITDSQHAKIMNILLNNKKNELLGGKTIMQVLGI